MTESTKIILAGEGGQGIQTIAKIISDVAAIQGMNVSYLPLFGVEQRGTPSVAFVIISHDKIFYPRFDKADHAIVLQKRAISKIEPYLSDKTKVIFDSSTIGQSDLPKTSSHLFGIPATKIAIENFSPKSFNMVVTGKISQVLNLDENKAWDKIKNLLGKKFKTKEIEEQNRQAFSFGRKYVFETADFTQPTFQPSKGIVVTKGHGMIAHIYPERCKSCAICIVKCPVGALRFSDTLGLLGTPVPEIDLEKCILCGNCFLFCPDCAIGVERVKKPRNSD